MKKIFKNILFIGVLSCLQAQLCFWSWLPSDCKDYLSNTYENLRNRAIIWANLKDLQVSIYLLNRQDKIEKHNDIHYLFYKKRDIYNRIAKQPISYLRQSDIDTLLSKQATIDTAMMNLLLEDLSLNEENNSFFNIYIRYDCDNSIEKFLELDMANLPVKERHNLEELRSLLELGHNKMKTKFRYETLKLCGYVVAILGTAIATYHVLKKWISRRTLKQERAEFYRTLSSVTITDLSIAGMHGYEETKGIFNALANTLGSQKKELTKIEGVILSGPPGNGKTTWVKALAGTTGLPLICVNINMLLNAKGEIGSNLKWLFEYAKSYAPCILYFDECDMIFPNRKNSGTRAKNKKKLTDRDKQILNNLLQELEGIGSDNKGILVVAATNYIEDIDDALLRYGRLGHHITVGHPSLSDQKIIAKALLKKYGVGYAKEDSFIEEMFKNIKENPSVVDIERYVKSLAEYISDNNIKEINTKSIEGLSFAF